MNTKTEITFCYPDGSEYPIENYVGPCLPKPISAEMEVTFIHDDLFEPVPDYIIVTDQRPVSFTFAPNRRWWKPWTWFRKGKEYRIPNGTVIRFSLIEGNPK